MNKNKYDNLSDFESQVKKDLLRLFENAPLSGMDKLNNLGLFLGRMQVQRIVTMAELYRLILDRHGIIMEFGTRFGYGIALLSALRGMYEPFVRSRKIVGFDTFEGFLSTTDQDHQKSAKGDFSVTKGYEDYLNELMLCHERQSPIAHIQKYEVIKGDATVEIGRYLKANPETIIAMALFDMNLYEPTKKCLQAIKGYMPKGSVVVFDQLLYHDHPGETVAFREVFGSSLQVHRTPFSSSVSYAVME